MWCKQHITGDPEEDISNTIPGEVAPKFILEEWKGLRRERRSERGRLMVSKGIISEKTVCAKALGWELTQLVGKMRGEVLQDKGAEEGRPQSHSILETCYANRPLFYKIKVWARALPSFLSHSDKTGRVGEAEGEGCSAIPGPPSERVQPR